MAIYQTFPQGEHYADVLKRADELKRAEEDLRRVMAPAESVTLKAKEIETDERMTRALGVNLMRGMGGTGTVGGWRFEVAVTHELDTDRYKIKIIDRQSPRNYLLRERGESVSRLIKPTTWYLDYETLVSCTASIQIYTAWLRRRTRRWDFQWESTLRRWTLCRVGIHREAQWSLPRQRTTWTGCRDCAKRMSNSQPY